MHEALVIVRKLTHVDQFGISRRIDNTLLQNCKVFDCSTVTCLSSLHFAKVHKTAIDKKRNSEEISSGYNKRVVGFLCMTVNNATIILRRQRGSNEPCVRFMQKVKIVS